jgi:cytochrome bd-type quinol oxidase subunit 1
MIYLGILFLAIGLVGFALHRAVPKTQPISTFIMYLGVPLGLILLVTGIIVNATQGCSIEVDSAGEITVR